MNKTDNRPIIEQLITEALYTLSQELNLPADHTPDICIERCRELKFGDFSCNIAMLLAKPAKQNPRALAERLIALLPSHPHIAKVDTAGPGFINFTLTPAARHAIIPQILSQKDRFGKSDLGNGKRVHIEYVSANPTGPLHVGHGRGAAFGACVANLLEAIGYDVHREYYVNDAGRQMRILALSTWLRYVELQGHTINLPSNAYQGDYIIDIAQELQSLHNDSLSHCFDSYQTAIASITDQDDKESYIDALIDAAQAALGDNTFDLIRNMTLMHILAGIQQDLAGFGVTYDDWFRESQLIDDGLIDAGVALLREHGYVYEQAGALWFKATELGDEKDRVLIRHNGQPTYFASDVAYHLHKYNAGFDHIIDVFGADHHGYIARIRAFLKGLNKDPDKLKVLLVQFAILYRGKEKMAMSTRSGEFVTLENLRDEVGNDAARFFYIMRKPEQHLDFDLELAKSQTNDNPVYYIQYAHARICSIWQQLREKKLSFDPNNGVTHLDELNTSHELELCTLLSRYPEVIEAAGCKHEPHYLAHYLQELANAFHGYYNASRFLVENESQREARLCLVFAIQYVIHNGLELLGVTAPEKM